MFRFSRKSLPILRIMIEGTFRLTPLGVYIMRSRFLSAAFIVAFVFVAFNAVQANAQYYLHPSPAVQVLPNVAVPVYVGPAIGYPYYPASYYPATYYWSAGYTYPASPAFYPVIPATYTLSTPYFPTPIYVAPYHRAFYSSYYYPNGYGYYYRGW